MILLSILICTLPERSKQFNSLVNTLNLLIKRENAQEKIEILHNNAPRGTITTGRKRQILLEQATGKYIVYIDDDDEVFKPYIHELYLFAQMDYDCAAIRGVYSKDGKNKVMWFISKDYDDVNKKHGGRMTFYRSTNHLCPIKKTIALEIGFEDISYQEDSMYSKGLKESGLLKSEYQIKPLLYHYKYNSVNKTYTK